MSVFSISGPANVVSIKFRSRYPWLSVAGHRQVVAGIPVKYGDESLDMRGDGVCIFPP